MKPHHDVDVLLGGVRIEQMVTYNEPSGAFVGRVAIREEWGKRWIPDDNAVMGSTAVRGARTIGEAKQAMDEWTRSLCSSDASLSGLCRRSRRRR